MGSPEDEEDRGDDETLHEVTVSRFAISRTEVTQAQFAAVMGRRPFEFEGPCREAGLGDDLPAMCVTWFEAVEYCNRLSKLEGITPAYTIAGKDVQWDGKANGYRLPTEAEWEYAARAGMRGRWGSTDEKSEVCRYGNVADESVRKENPDWEAFPCDDGYPRLAPVEREGVEESRWRLLGMTGNVWEWVWDRYEEYPTEAVRDPRGPDGGVDIRVGRGASFGAGPRGARVAIRYGNDPPLRFNDLGFRLAKSGPFAN